MVSVRLPSLFNWPLPQIAFNALLLTSVVSVDTKLNDNIHSRISHEDPEE
jgi:hypothetical protein